MKTIDWTRPIETVHGQRAMFLKRSDHCGPTAKVLVNTSPAIWKEEFVFFDDGTQNRGFPYLLNVEETVRKYLVVYKANKASLESPDSLFARLYSSKKIAEDSVHYSSEDFDILEEGWKTYKV